MLPTSAFDYSYPPELIAQRPLADRAASRLLVLRRDTGAIEHRQFRDFPALLSQGDVLVRNVSRVIPARLRATRDNGRPAEILLVHPHADGTWLAMVHPGGKLKVGRRVRFGSEAMGEIVEVVGGGLRRIAFTGLGVHELMERFGTTPLPPYITRPADDEDRTRYQTVYARDAGSVAAPTAGLHFTDAMLDQVRARGAAIADVTLHVGPGTFKPVEEENPSRHEMHAEWFQVPAETFAAIERARARGQRVWAVGTTAVRTLETVAQRHGETGAQGQGGRAAPRQGGGVDHEIAGCSGWADLFIYPPYDFRWVAGLLTNFHRPRSTLLMLVAAFGGYEHTMAAYREAIGQRYRLFSYGDAMAVI
jgi:S-adenosylmethionine:tRNA ribosyltransferase-isomerase